ncbi:MAG: cytochrome c oxidase subunit II [Proteobacteria bacterium]|nr:MAG: cytochrome c oxidase subunit II [Pseudomonadota bacterium]
MIELLQQSGSSFASDINNLILWITILGGFWLVVAEVILFWLVWKFRKKPGVKASYITGERKEEMKWIHWPHNLILLCDVIIIVMAIRVWYTVKQDLPPAQSTIRVIGQQWAWRYVMPGADNILGTADDIETVDELHLKVDTVYHFKLESTDVLHSFSIPQFRLKQDALPGRIITGWFKPTKVGNFDIQCAEMCGIGHGIMMSKLFVETAEDYDKWIAGHTPAAVTSR